MGSVSLTVRSFGPRTRVARLRRRGRCRTRRRGWWWWWWRGGGFLARRWNFFFGGRVRHVGADVMFFGLLFQCDHIGEIKRRRSRHGLSHELHPDGQRGKCSRFPLAQGNLFVVVADPDARGQLRRESHEPGVSEVLRGPGFPGRGAPERFGF